MLRRSLALVAVVYLFAAASPAQAQWLGNCWHNMVRDFHRNNEWPQPFVQPDRASVNVPINLQVAKGWAAQNLLCDYHFRPDTAQLTQAGDIRVRQILAQTPPQYRTVYVQQAATMGLTAARMAAVQETVVRLSSNGPIANVVVSNDPTPGRAASDVNATLVSMEKNHPDAVLPKASGSGVSGANNGN